MQYRDGGAQAAAVLFHHWEEANSARTCRTWVAQVAGYEPGAFYRRELPCLLSVLREIELSLLEAIVIDGYVQLEPRRPGLGAHLYKALAEHIPVIGVAKTRFQGCEAVAAPLVRGSSRVPLWITAEGIALDAAVQHIASMHGPHRMPTLLAEVDHLCRQR